VVEEAFGRPRLRENFSAYDASHVALADQLDASLLTADAALVRAGARTRA
jgi:predicted nucleic acid-binding protein